jgi:hypothetical protein
VSRTGASIANRIRKQSGGAPKCAPTGRKLTTMTDGQLAAALREHREHIRRVQRSGTPETTAERQRTLDAVRRSIESVKRLDGEWARRAAEAVPARVTSTAVGERADVPSPDGARQVPLSQMPTARLQAAHEWAAVRAEHRAKREQAWEAREREKREQAEARREGEKQRQAERRRLRAEQGLAPEQPGEWSRWHADAADTLAAVFSDPTVWLTLFGRDFDRLDRDPPLHASHVVVLYAVLATIAARGTREVVLPERASAEWMPVAFQADRSGAGSAAKCIDHLAANGLLAVRREGGRLYVSRGPVAEQLRAGYVECGREPGAA